MKPLSRDPPPWLPGFSKAGQVLVLALGALLTATAWFYQTGTIQLIVALIGQGFWVLAYLNWQRGQQAPRVIRDLLPEIPDRVPCQVWVVIEGVGVFRDAGALVPEQAGIAFEGLQMSFVLEPKDIRLVEDPNFGSDARAIGLKSPNFQMKLKFIPYRAFANDLSQDPRENLSKIMRGLAISVRNNQDLRLPSFPVVPFKPYDYWSMLLRAWFRRGVGIGQFVLVCYSMSQLPVDSVIVIVAAFLLIVGCAALARGNAARQASIFIFRQLDEAKQQRFTSPEPEILNLTS